MRKNSTSRNKLVETTSRLFQLQGYHGTGLNQILEESRAPKGSLYYYFPKGKEELACEAVRYTHDTIEKRIREGLSTHDDPIEAIQAFVRVLALSLERSPCSQGVPVAGVAIETASTSEPIREACREAYESWSRAFADKLTAGGYEPERAAKLGRVLNAMIEGAIIISITRRDPQVLLEAADQIPSILGK